MIKSQTQIETDVKKQLHNDLYDYLVCQRCQIVPKTGAIYICSKGEHAMCADCFISRKCGKCCICFASITCLSKGLEQLRNRLPLSCKYRKNGCKTVLTMDSMLYHEPECQLRFIFCPDCGKKVLFQELGRHLTTLHKNIVNYKLSFFEDYFIVKEKNYSMKFASWLPTQFSLKKAQFFLKVILQNGRFYFWVYYHGSSEETKNYKCTIKVFKDGADEKYIYNATVRSLDESMETIIEDENALVIGVSQIRRLVSNENLKCFVKVSCPKEEEIDKAKKEDVDSDLSD
jgi:hypothetical protein